MLFGMKNSDDHRGAGFVDPKNTSLSDTDG
jgi:hypothetical protein